MTFGILQRYVMGEVIRTFVMALVALTVIFVLFMVMAEASKLGLSPRDIMTLIPYVIPGTLPFTVPVSMLFAVTVVYGRLASDNEIIAVKTAGRSAMVLLWPTIFLGAALWIASGRTSRVEWRGVQEAFVNHTYWGNKINEFETEVNFRAAQSFGSLMFVVLGAPVGILFARRDFLSAFITCFLPIILLYYPLMLLGVNLGKEGVVDPVVTLWAGNVLLGLLAGFAIPPVLRH